jgi:hypothetical protein
MLSFFVHICKDNLLTGQKIFRKRIPQKRSMSVRRRLALVRSFHVICPFCDGAYPFPDDLDEVYKCQCGAVYKIAWRSDIEGAVDQLIKFFLRDRQTLEAASERNVLCNAVVYEDIENLITMKREYEASKYIRQSQNFDQNYPQKVGLIWLGSYAGS